LLNAFDEAGWNGPAPSDVAPSVGSGVEALWYDTFVHADDIRAAVGRPTVVSGGLRASVHHLAALLKDKGWGPAVLSLDGVEEVRVGGEGEEQRVTGDAMQFVLVATGRLDPATLGLTPEVNVYAD
jgi:uncharacterized protein (TIGR03083 family)